MPPARSRPCRRPRSSRPSRARDRERGSRRGKGAGWSSGVHLHEAVVELTLVVEDGAPDVVLGPGQGGEIRVGPVSAGEHLVAGPERVEEVDGRTAGDA